MEYFPTRRSQPRRYPVFVWQALWQDLKPRRPYPQPTESTARLRPRKDLHHTLLHQ
jgi:hypothetical protein